MKLYTVLLHYPVYNKNGEIIVTSIVVHNIHDMARAGKTFGVKNFYIVQPFVQERKIAERIKKFWQTKGKKYNSNRSEAIAIVKLKESFEEVVQDIVKEEGKMPIIIGTSAQEKKDKKMVSFEKMQDVLKEDDPVLIVFGTGWGIAKPVMEKINFFLPPIKGTGAFNHLSVRSAYAIILYRLTNTY